MKRALNEEGRAVLLGAVAVTDEDVLTIEVISSAVASGLPFFLVAFEDDGTATVDHILARTIEIGTLHRLAAPHGYAIVALGTSTAIIPRYEEVIIAAVLKDKGGLDGVGTSKFRGGVLFRWFIAGVVATGDGLDLSFEF